MATEDASLRFCEVVSIMKLHTFLKVESSRGKANVPKMENLSLLNQLLVSLGQ